jgi:hypothetical protein
VTYGVNCLSSRSTIREELFQPGTILLDAEKRIGLIFAVTQAVNIVVCAILPNDFRWFSKTLPAAVKMIASTKPGGIRFNELAKILRWSSVDKASYQEGAYEKERKGFHKSDF